jgi:type II secretory pathway component PulF
VFFLTLQTYVTPRFTEIFQRVKVPLPSLTVFFVSISQAVQGAPAIVLLVLAGLAAALVHFRRRRFLPRAVLAMGVASFALCIGLVAALSLPFLTILQGVGGR